MSSSKLRNVYLLLKKIPGIVTIPGGRILKAILYGVNIKTLIIVIYFAVTILLATWIGHPFDSFVDQLFQTYVRQIGGV